MSDYLLQVESLKKTYSRGDLRVNALGGVTLDIPPGQFVAVMGASGSGKSTLLHLIGGLDRASAGSVIIDGQEISKLGDKELSHFRRRKLGFIFQFFNLLPTMTALENVALPWLLDGKKLSEVSDKALALLHDLGLSKRADHTPHQLSGGEMQRVAIARALVADPVLILADEPTGNLDSKTGESVLKILSDMAKHKKQTIVMVTHSKDAASHADRLITMRDGLIDQSI